MTGIHSGKTAIITGGASGIGEGIVRRLAAEGAKIVVADLNGALAKDVAQSLDADAIAVTLDMTDEAAVDGLIDQTTARFGGLDIMVNNAGIIQIAPVADTSYADWKRIMDVNVDGVFLGCRAAARAMVAQGRGGTIVNASSGAGRRGVPNISGYCASKAAIIMLTQSLAVELAPHKITVNCYAPGHIKTPFWTSIAEGFSKVLNKSPDEVVEMFRATVPMGRFGTPDDVAATVSWLASPDAAYVSGQAIAMNGAEFPF
ncbi:MAG: glucose 1-dehydrogenase [Rhodobacteraceae bacterium]|nr:glucose 1-dehydrogenase [Paracoccaceae bacterium]